MEEKKPHPNQYKEPHFTCEIHYGPDSDKYIREYQQMKAASFREKHKNDKHPIRKLLLSIDTGKLSIFNQNIFATICVLRRRK